METLFDGARFDGSTYDARCDQQRLAGQMARVDFQLSEMYPLHRGQEKG